MSKSDAGKGLNMEELSFRSKRLLFMAGAEEVVCCLRSCLGLAVTSGNGFKMDSLSPCFRSMGLSWSLGFPTRLVLLLTGIEGRRTVLSLGHTTGLGRALPL